MLIFFKVWLVTGALVTEQNISLCHVPTKALNTANQDEELSSYRLLLHSDLFDATVGLDFVSSC